MKSEAKKRADSKWESKAYDKVLLRIRKDTEPTRETITAAAESVGMSLNAFIMEAVKEKIQRDDSGGAG